MSIQRGDGAPPDLRAALQPQVFRGDETHAESVVFHAPATHERHRGGGRTVDLARRG
jgi:hypothetical protein